MAEQDAVCEFFRDDDGYLHWVAAHPDGYVVNIARSDNTADARLHSAGCRTINGRPPLGGQWTEPYKKVCADELAALDQWATNRGKRAVRRCGICHPAQAISRSTAGEPRETSRSAVGSDRCYIIHGPTLGNPVVQAWAKDYIRFERRPPWQCNLRNEIRGHCRQLVPAPGQVLHATFFGKKLPNADVENLVLYNIDSFKNSGRNGIRFEHAPVSASRSDAAEYRFSYRYALASRADSFSHWQNGRTVASFNWTDLGRFTSEKQLAQVWLALWRGQTAQCFQPIEPNAPFGIRVEVRPPKHRRPVWGGLMKGIIDGVICAFQTHGETPVDPEVLERLARSLQTEPDEIQRYLLDQSRSVFGVRPRLVSRFQSGVKWDPSDHLCVAGELLAAESTSAGDSWAIKGELFELLR